MRERGSGEVLDLCWVEFHQTVELLLCDFGPPVGLEVVLDQLRGGEINRVDEGEKCSLVLHISIQDWNIGNLARSDQFIRTLSQELSIRTKSPRGSQTAESEEVVDGIGVREYLFVRGLTETGDLVSGAVAAYVTNHVVEEVLLAFWTFDSEGTAGNTDCCAEQTFVIALVGYEVASNGPGSSTLAHDSDFGRVASESCNVLLDPSKSDTLVFETQVQQTGTLKFSGGREAEVVQAVVDGGEEDGFAFFDGALDDVGTLVEYSREGGLQRMSVLLI